MMNGDWGAGDNLHELYSRSFESYRPYVLLIVVDVDDRTYSARTDWSGKVLQVEQTHRIRHSSSRKLTSEEGKKMSCEASETIIMSDTNLGGSSDDGGQAAGCNNNGAPADRWPKADRKTGFNWPVRDLSRLGTAEYLSGRIGSRLERRRKRFCDWEEAKMALMRRSRRVGFWTGNPDCRCKLQKRILGQWKEWSGADWATI